MRGVDEHRALPRLAFEPALADLPSERRGEGDQREIEKDQLAVHVRLPGISFFGTTPATVRCAPRILSF